MGGDRQSRGRVEIPVEQPFDEIRRDAGLLRQIRDRDSESAHGFADDVFGEIFYRDPHGGYFVDPLYTFMLPLRKNPMRFWPDPRANSTASELGAEMPATVGMPAASAFCISSKEILPLSRSVCPERGSPPSSREWPITLSRALWRPTSLAQHDDLAVRAEHRAGVQAAGLVEGRLRRAELVRIGGDGGHVDRWRGGDLWELDEDRLDGRLAADAAARRAEHVPGEGLAVELRAVRQQDIDDVAAPRVVIGVARALGYFEDVPGFRGDALAEQEAGGELPVVPGRAHHDGDAVALDADLEGLLARHVVRRPGPAIGRNLLDAELFGGLTHSAC